MQIMHSSKIMEIASDKSVNNALVDLEVFLKLFPFLPLWLTKQSHDTSIACISFSELPKTISTKALRNWNVLYFLSLLEDVVPSC